VRFDDEKMRQRDFIRLYEKMNGSYRGSVELGERIYERLKRKGLTRHLTPEVVQILGNIRL